MPQALALAAQTGATLSLLVIPVLGLFLLSLAWKASVRERKVLRRGDSTCRDGGRRLNQPQR